jgi:hypothetical protein
MSGDPTPQEVAVEALGDMPDQATMHFCVAFQHHLDGEPQEALDSMEFAAEMYEMEVLG